MIATANPEEEHFIVPVDAPLPTKTVPNGYSETKGEIVEETRLSCKIHEDCKLDPKWAIQSNCPYQARCMDEQCVVICPAVEQDLSEGTSIYERVDWDTAEQAIKRCFAESVMQNHQREVWVTLKDGQMLYAIEPELDDVIYAAQSVQGSCGGMIEIATE